MGFGFEKHFGKTDPFVIEFTWKFLPVLGCREGAMTPSFAGQCCCSAALWYLLGGALLFHGLFQGHQAQLKKLLLFFQLCIAPILAVHPSSAQEYPFGQAELCVASLCPSLWQEFEWERRVFLPLLFGGSHQQEICISLRPRARCEAGGQSCSKSWRWGEPKALNILFNPIQYVMENPCTQASQHCLSQLHRVFCTQPCSEVVPSSEGTMWTWKSRQCPGIPWNDGSSTQGGMPWAVPHPAQRGSTARKAASNLGQ